MATFHSNKNIKDFLESIDNSELKELMLQMAVEDPEFEEIANMTGAEIRYYILNHYLKNQPLKNPEHIWVAKVAKKYDFYPKDIEGALKLNEYKGALNKKRCGINACVIGIGNFDDKFLQKIKIFARKSDDQRIGFAIIGIGEKMLFVQYLFVLPEHRKNGVCSMFIEELKDNLKDRTLVLGTNNSVMLRLLHNRGFKVKGIMGDGKNGELELHFKHCSHKYECGCGKKSCLEMGLEKCEEDFCDNESCRHYYKNRNDNCDCGKCGYCLDP